MSPSRFPSCTSLFVSLVAAAGAPGCGGEDSCGPGGAPGVVAAAGTGVTVTYGQLNGSPNRDCPDPAAPDNVISLSIHGTQTDGTGLITLCIGRPDLLAGQALTFGAEPGAQVHVVDLNGSANGCTLTIDRSQPPSGTATSTGLCANGDDPGGFALGLDVSLRFTRTCGTTVDTVPVMLRGSVAVSGPR